MKKSAPIVSPVVKNEDLTATEMKFKTNPANDPEMAVPVQSPILL